MYNIRSYVKSEVESLAKANKVSLAADRIEGIVDSILFDWNEIGDPYADLEDLITCSRSASVRRCCTKPRISGIVTASRPCAGTIQRLLLHGPLMAGFNPSFQRKMHLHHYLRIKHACSDHRGQRAARSAIGPVCSAIGRCQICWPR